MLPNAKVGQLASYRTLLIKNKYLAILAQQVELQKYLLKGATGSTEHLTSEQYEPQPSSSSSVLSTSSSSVAIDSAAHTIANTLEAVIGAVYLDTGLLSVQRLTAQLFFPEEVCAAPYYISFSVILSVFTGPARCLDELPSRFSTSVYRVAC